jgi:CO dehydrogenase/acetyl-CoA synthase beta subunit
MLLPHHRSNRPCAAAAAATQEEEEGEEEEEEEEEEEGKVAEMTGHNASWSGGVEDGSDGCLAIGRTIGFI